MVHKTMTTIVIVAKSVTVIVPIMNYRRVIKAVEKLLIFF